SRVIALDADPDAVARAEALRERQPRRVTPVHANFAQLADALESVGVSGVNGIVYDLGLSSLQLGDAARGFAFAGEGALDMRLDPTSDAATAAQLLATAKEGEIADIIFEFGDERNARRIAREIVKRRTRSPLRTTSDLVAAVLAAQPRSARGRRGNIHPATRTFLALRMAVNAELDSLAHSLEEAIACVQPGGRIAVISFHSGEDRVVKHQFAAWRRTGVAETLTRKPLTPTQTEIAANPRSRSAKLRGTERTHAPMPRSA
ncbi:MAG: 16S rRNA (cytosine(1402)-N(4))-methyltransferase RsmH, partial [Candidatus Eremiobacteraeota bacterium]|nr:16S rRNA (cytosine(1402)-N(4))-methyltransferase RsmH [Candidatus Eremiobacteraeota bacterium]